MSWRTRVGLLSFLFVFSTPLSVKAETVCVEGTCVAKEDMGTFIQLLRDQKCRTSHPPELTLDPIVVVEDKEGRVYGSGAQPRPYTIRMTWCNYEVVASGKVQLTVAKREPPVWGFRFRPKFSSGFLFASAFVKQDALSAIDVGVLWEGFYYRSVNLNLATGFRSVGIGLGVDLLKNVTLYGGYAVSYEGWLSNPYVAVGIALW